MRGDESGAREGEGCSLCFSAKGCCQPVVARRCLLRNASTAAWPLFSKILNTGQSL